MVCFAPFPVQTERGFVGSGHTLGSSASTPPRAMGDSRDTNADHLERKAPPPELVHKLMGMGFPRDRAIAALQRTKNDADTAADMLLGGGSAEDRMWLHGGGAPMAPRAPTARCGIGLGLADHWDNAGPRVADILPYSPAAECMAFTKGDKIVGIDGVNVKGLGVDAIKPMILGPPGSTIKISFVPCPTRAWSASPFSSADPFRMAERPITVTLIRTVRREAAQDEADAEAEAAEAPWYTTWWKGVQKGAAKTSKNVEDSLVEAGEHHSVHTSSTAPVSTAPPPSLCEAVVSLGYAHLRALVLALLRDFARFLPAFFHRPAHTRLRPLCRRQARSWVRPALPSVGRPRRGGTARQRWQQRQGRVCRRVQRLQGRS